MTMAHMTVTPSLPAASGQDVGGDLLRPLRLLEAQRVDVGRVDQQIEEGDDGDADEQRRA